MLLLLLEIDVVVVCNSHRVFYVLLRTVDRLIELVRVESNVVVCMVVFVKSCVKREIKPLFECPGIWSQQFYVCLSLLLLLLINQL